jgi:hypothetical protein
MRDLLISFALGVLFALPWIGAAVWIRWRVGWRVMWSESGKPFPTQATSLRSFSLADPSPFMQVLNDQDRELVGVVVADADDLERPEAV